MQSEAEHVYTTSETLFWVAKLAIGFFGILALIFLLTVLTPKIARWVDKKRGKPSSVTRYDAETYKVKGLFDGDSAAATTSRNEETENGKGEEAGGIHHQHG